MSKRLAPPSDLSLETLQELIAVIVYDHIRNEEPIDAGMTAIEAGLSDEEQSSFLAWVREIELREEARETAKELSITTDRLVEWMNKHPGEPFPEK